LYLLTLTVVEKVVCRLNCPQVEGLGTKKSPKTIIKRKYFKENLLRLEKKPKTTQQVLDSSRENTGVF